MTLSPWRFLGVSLRTSFLAGWHTIPLELRWYWDLCTLTHHLVWGGWITLRLKRMLLRPIHICGKV